MERHTIGIEEATQALLVRNVFREAMKSSKTQVEALQRLTAKLSLERILYKHENSQTDGSTNASSFLSVEQPVSTPVVRHPGPSSTSSRQKVGLSYPVPSGSTSDKSKAISRNVTVQRKKTGGSTSATRNKHAKNQISRKTNNNNSSATAAATMSTTPSLTGRKRLMEEMESTSRPRADSLTDQVDAKIVAETPSSTTTGTHSIAVGPRAKRVHRMNNSDCPEGGGRGISTSMNATTSVHSTKQR
jgi:hypothetical protein